MPAPKSFEKWAYRPILSKIPKNMYIFQPKWPLMGMGFMVEAAHPPRYKSEYPLLLDIWAAA